MLRRCTSSSSLLVAGIGSKARHSTTPGTTVGDIPPTSSTSSTSHSDSTGGVKVETIKVRSSQSGEGKPKTKSPRRHSGLQLDILSLYRSLLRGCMKFSDAGTRDNLRSQVRFEFRQQMKIPRQHITTIQWHLDHGRRKLEDIQGWRKDMKYTVVISPPTPTADH